MDGGKLVREGPAACLIRQLTDETRNSVQGSSQEGPHDDELCILSVVRIIVLATWGTPKTLRTGKSSLLKLHN